MSGKIEQIKGLIKVGKLKDAVDIAKAEGLMDKDVDSPSLQMLTLATIVNKETEKETSMDKLEPLESKDVLNAEIFKDLKPMLYVKVSNVRESAKMLTLTDMMDMKSVPPGWYFMFNGKAFKGVILFEDSGSKRVPKISHTMD